VFCNIGRVVMVAVLRAWSPLAAAVACALFTVACGGADEDPERVGETLTGSSPLNRPSAVLAAPCESGHVQTCRVELPEHNGVKTCFTGVQLCVEGRFSECVDEETLDQQLADLD
jgi:hypothetical protein